MNRKSKLFLIISSIIFILVLGLPVANISYISTAQDDSLSIKSRLELLREEMNAGNIMIGFQFIVPIAEGNNYWLFGDPTDERALTILEIEDDHFCFSQTNGQAVLIRCVPFTNIASFDYLGS